MALPRRAEATARHSGDEGMGEGGCKPAGVERSVMLLDETTPFAA